MLNPSNDYGRRALDFVCAMQGAASRDEIMRLTVVELEAFGLPFMTSWSARRDVSVLEDSIDLNTRPADYVAYYLAEEVQLRDPIMLAMRNTLSALTWREATSLFAWSKAELALVAEGRDFGANDGFTIPIFSGGAFLGAFSACGWDPDLCDDARAALRIVGMTAHQALMRTGLADRRRDHGHAALTPREREIMRWVAAGKSNDEIGDILGIGTATVKTMLGRAQVKLDATGRTYAVVQALRLGEIDLG